MKAPTLIMLDMLDYDYLFGMSELFVIDKVENI